tara:strand:- start:1015 stop:1821 length:807 start_codon:yes stop_codon:yes gene_type:complete
MSLSIHNKIKTKIDKFAQTNNVPNILLYGSCGSGKRYLVNYLINKIYDNDKNTIKDFVKIENCAHGKGIKFIREDLKFFAKTNLNTNGSNIFKTIILLNADKLTIDAQSALRRCIEVFSNTTRFVMVVEDRYKLLKPILSRLCDIYVPLPIINNIEVNLHHVKINDCFCDKYDKKKLNKLRLTLQNFKPKTTKDVVEMCNLLYNNGYSALDVINNMEKHSNDDISKYTKLITFNKVKRELKNEKLLLLFILNFIYLRSEYNLENVCIM